MNRMNTSDFSDWIVLHKRVFYPHNYSSIHKRCVVMESTWCPCVWDMLLVVLWMYVRWDTWSWRTRRVWIESLSTFPVNDPRFEDIELCRCWTLLWDRSFLWTYKALEKKSEPKLGVEGYRGYAHAHRTDTWLLRQSEADQNRRRPRETAVMFILLLRVKVRGCWVSFWYERFFFVVAALLYFNFYSTTERIMMADSFDFSISIFLRNTHSWPGPIDILVQTLNQMKFTIQ